MSTHDDLEYLDPGDQALLDFARHRYVQDQAFAAEKERLDAATLEAVKAGLESLDDEPAGDDAWTRERDEARARARGLGAALWLLAIVAGVLCAVVAFLVTRDALAIGLAFVGPLLLVWGAAIERQDGAR